MARLTITLSDERRRALEEAAARRSKSIGQLIEERLEFYGIKTGQAPRRCPRSRNAGDRRGTSSMTRAVVVDTTVVAYCNVLSGRQPDGSRSVYLLHYGVPALDEATSAAFSALGLGVAPVAADGVTPNELMMLGGGLICLAAPLFLGTKARR